MDAKSAAAQIKQARQLFRDGENLVVSKKPKEGEDKIQQALALSLEVVEKAPNTVEAYEILSQIFLRRGDRKSFLYYQKGYRYLKKGGKFPEAELPRLEAEEVTVTVTPPPKPKEKRKEIPREVTTALPPRLLPFPPPVLREIPPKSFRKGLQAPFGPRNVPAKGFPHATRARVNAGEKRQAVSFSVRPTRFALREPEKSPGVRHAPPRLRPTRLPPSPYFMLKRVIPALLVPAIHLLPALHAVRLRPADARRVVLAPALPPRLKPHAVAPPPPAARKIQVVLRTRAFSSAPRLRLRLPETRIPAPGVRLLFGVKKPRGLEARAVSKATALEIRKPRPSTFFLVPSRVAVSREFRNRRLLPRSPGNLIERRQAFKLREKGVSPRSIFLAARSRRLEPLSIPGRLGPLPVSEAKPLTRPGWLPPAFPVPKGMKTIRLAVRPQPARALLRDLPARAAIPLLRPHLPIRHPLVRKPMAYPVPLRGMSLPLVSRVRGIGLEPLRLLRTKKAIPRSCVPEEPGVMPVPEPRLYRIPIHAAPYAMPSISMKSREIAPSPAVPHGVRILAPSLLVRGVPQSFAMAWRRGVPKAADVPALFWFRPAIKPKIPERPYAPPLVQPWMELVEFGAITEGLTPLLDRFESGESANLIWAAERKEEADKLLLRGKEEEALEAYSDAAQALVEAGDIQGAAEMLVKALQCSPGNLEILRRLERLQIQGAFLRSEIKLEIQRKIYGLKI